MWFWPYSNTASHCTPVDWPYREHCCASAGHLTAAAQVSNTRTSLLYLKTHTAAQCCTCLRMSYLCTASHARWGCAGVLIPKITRSALQPAVAVLGAVIMPHNIYLHSALVHSRYLLALTTAATNASPATAAMPDMNHHWCNLPGLLSSLADTACKLHKQEFECAPHNALHQIRSGPWLQWGRLLAQYVCQAAVSALYWGMLQEDQRGESVSQARGHGILLN